MSIERLRTTPPLNRREAGLVIINYILDYKDRRETARRMAQFSIGGATLDGGSHVVDPTIADTELSLVNATLLSIGGIDAVVERDSSPNPVPIYLMEWHGPNPSDPRRHNWAAYHRDTWDAWLEYRHTFMPKPDPLEFGIDLELLHEKVCQSIQVGSAA